MPMQKKNTPAKATKQVSPSAKAKTQANPKAKATVSPKKAKPAPEAPVKAKAKLKAPAKASSIRLLQLTAKGQKSTDPVLQAYQPKKGSLAFSEVLNALCMAQRDPALQASTLWGLLTPDFTKRTGLTGQALLDVIETNPGFDLYYASAHPELEALYHNPWRSPEVTHPEFVALSRRFLKAAGLSDVPVDSISASDLFATGHLMVATPELWAKYVGFVEAVFDQVHKNMDEADKDKLFNEAPIPSRMGYLALMIARLLNVFLMLRNSNYRAFKIPLPEQEKAMNSHLRFLREMKDIGISQKSKWHLAAWVNYRGLYLAHVMGKAWLAQHIRAITPTDLHIAVPIAQVDNRYVTSLAPGKS